MIVKNTYTINEPLSLKLVEEPPERDITLIYVDNKEFMVCHYLLLKISGEKFKVYDEISSIDEAEEIYNKKNERKPDIISSKEEFFGHCSNFTISIL